MKKAKVPSGLRMIMLSDPKSPDTLSFNTNLILNDAGIPLAIYAWPNKQVSHYGEDELDDLYEPLSLALTEIEKAAGKPAANIIAKLQAMEEIETTSVTKHSIVVTKGVAFVWDENLINRVAEAIASILTPLFSECLLKKQVEQTISSPKKRKLKEFNPDNLKSKRPLKTIFPKNATKKTVTKGLKNK